MLSLLIFIALGLSQVQSQTCPDSPIILNFDAGRYLGTWYEIKVFPNPFQPDLSCVSATYGDGGTNNVTVFNQGYTSSGERTTIQGYATVTNANRPNHLLVVLRVPIAPGITVPSNGKLDIWDTDYNTYSLAYSCSKEQKDETAWILSRTRTLDPDTIKKLEDKLKEKGVDASKFKSTNQFNCPN